MADTAADVPAKFDVVVNGHGYLLLDSLESSMPFRTHRAIYGQTQPFVERQNVSNSYGDNAQDFFLTIRQRDWSLGEQQRFFRAGQDGRYWMGSNVDVSTPGEVKLTKSAPSLSMAGSIVSGAREGNGQNVLVASATNLYRIDPAGTVTDLGAHGVGATPAPFGMATDGDNTYISSTAAAGNIREWNGTTFSTFSTSPADSLAYLNNSLYGLRPTNNRDLVVYSTTGVVTPLFTWKNVDGGVGGGLLRKIEAFGGKLLILFSFGSNAGGELWIYDGAGVTRLEIFPENFYAWDIEVLYGVAYISGSFFQPVTGTTGYFRPAVLFYDGSQIGKLWQTDTYSTSTITTTVYPTNAGPHPALGIQDGKLLFTDERNGNVLAYSPETGGVSTIATVATGGSSTRIVTGGLHVVSLRGTTTTYYFPSSTTATSGYIQSSLIDFDSSLTKVFRGVTVEFDSASDGDGGSIDLAYQIGALSGSWTSLATGITSGTEVAFPAATTGHAIAIKVTLNKGTSTAGPTLKSMSVRGAPVMPIYKRATYILDCTSTEDAPRELRDGTNHPLTGYEQVQNLVTARNSTTPVSITDKINGTFTGFVDVNDPEGFDVYEVHPSVEDPAKAGSYVVRLTVRGV